MNFAENVVKNGYFHQKNDKKTQKLKILAEKHVKKMKFFTKKIKKHLEK